MSSRHPPPLHRFWSFRLTQGQREKPSPKAASPKQKERPMEAERTPEQQARNMLERLGIDKALDVIAEDVVEIANPSAQRDELLEASAKMAGFLSTWRDCLAGVAMSEDDFKEDSGLKEYRTAIAKAKGDER